MCTFSKWVETRATENQTGETVAKFLEEQVFSRHGSPQYLLSDNGPAYISKILKIHTNNYGVRHKFITPYHSEANGLIERFNRTVVSMLTKFVNASRNDWDKYLCQVTFAYNTTIQSTTKFTPFEVLYGRTPHLPYDYPMPSRDLSSWNDHLERIHNMRKLVAANIAKEQRQVKERIDKKRADHEFKIGDLVFILKPMAKFEGKFSRLYEGKCVVMEKHSPLTYTVKNLETQNIFKVHMKRMKACNTYKTEDDSDSSETSVVIESEVEENQFIPEVLENVQSSSTEARAQSRYAQITRSGRAIRPPSYLKDYVWLINRL